MADCAVLAMKVMEPTQATLHETSNSRHLKLSLQMLRCLGLRDEEHKVTGGTLQRQRIRPEPGNPVAVSYFDGPTATYTFPHAASYQCDWGKEKIQNDDTVIVQKAEHWHGFYPTVAGHILCIKTYPNYRRSIAFGVKRLQLRVPDLLVMQSDADSWKLVFPTTEHTTYEFQFGPNNFGFSLSRLMFVQEVSKVQDDGHEQS